LKNSLLSKIRSRYGMEVFQRFFEAIVEQCHKAKLVWGKEVYFDSTQVNANADLDSLAPRFAVEAREAIREHLAALFAPEPGDPEASHGKEDLTTDDVAHTSNNPVFPISRGPCDASLYTSSGDHRFISRLLC
jgi:hypothetical protein